MAKTMASIPCRRSPPPSSLLPRAWSRALIRLTCGPLHHSPSPFPFPFERLPQRLCLLQLPPFTATRPGFANSLLMQILQLLQIFRLRYVFHSVITFQAVAAAGSDMVGFSLLIHSKRFFGSFSNSAVGRI